MGEMVTFPSNGGEAQGYLAVPAGGSGPGVIVIEEWWGLNQQIKEVCDRYASEGFVALSPDVYGREVPIGEPDEAAQMMMALNIEQAAKDLSGAVDFLQQYDAVSGRGIGVVGFCAGGGLALWLATYRPDAVKAVVPYYGIVPWPAVQPEYSKLQAAVQGHYAENDDFADPESVRKLEEELKGLGKDVEFFIYPDTTHAFSNHHRPDVFNEEHTETAWRRTVDFFRRHLM
ncbi:MAG TPA: dienelactone hydrolase family protein [Acidimicrobiia bacterium]